MNLFKRALAGVAAACTVLTTCTACGENTATAMTINGTEIPAGVYLYYVTNAYYDAMGVLEEGGETFENVESTKDVKKIMQKSDIDGVHADEWIQNKAIEYCQTYVTVQQEFERLNLTLSGQELAEIEAGVENSKAYFTDFFRKTGISDKSIKSILTLNYQEDKIWEATYGEGGSKGIQEDTLYDHYKDNHLRIKYIEMPLKDGEGNLLKSDGKKTIEDMAKDYLARLEKKADDEAKLMSEFDYLIDEHNTYVTSISEAAVTTTDENGSTITTETTAKVTTTEEGDETTADGEQTETTAEGTTTTKAETTTTTKAGDTTDTTETTVAGGETTTTTTETTTAPADETTDAETETADETTTTTTTVNGLGYDTFKEQILVVSTASSEEKKPDETTTAPTYTPCQKVYEWAADAKTPLLKPELIKDDECYYIVVKLDVEDRMTSDDLWTSYIMEGVRDEMYHDEFMDMLEDMGKKLDVDRNEKAFRRYKVLDVDVVEYQAAMMQSYYSSYNY